MPGRQHTNWRAAQLVTELRKDHGWSPRDLQNETVRRSLRPVSERTIRRIEATGVEPIASIQFALAQAFGLLPSHVWGRVPLPVDYRPTVAA